MNKPSYLVISDWTTSTGSEWRLQVFVETGHRQEYMIQMEASGVHGDMPLSSSRPKDGNGGLDKPKLRAS
jgi:hypothetical protein